MLSPDYPFLPALFLLGALMQLCAFLRGGGKKAFLVCAAGAVLVCLAALEERDITLCAGQIGILCLLWRVKFSGRPL